jgi:hypothetical protein
MGLVAATPTARQKLEVVEEKETEQKQQNNHHHHHHHHHPRPILSPQ